MSDRFLVLVDPRGAARNARRCATARAAGLSAIFEQGATQVFVGAETPWVALPNGRGVVIGTIFDRSVSDARSAQALRRIPLQGELARWMVETLWGRYLAILTDERGFAVDVLRDPMGLMACYRASDDGETGFAPDARLLQRCGLIRGAVDWTSAARSLAFPDFRDSQTGLVGVIEPAPGEVVRLRKGGFDTGTVWTPDRFCRDRRSPDLDGCVQAVRDTVDEVVSAWMRDSCKALVSLSGGLDSSVVAASVPDAPARLAAFNVRSGRGRGDEREFARDLAQQIGITLEEFDISGDDVDVQRSLAVDQPQASARSFTQPFDRLAAALANRVGADMHLNGGGGDNVFAFLHSANPAADRLLAHGPGRGFVRTVLDLAELTQCTAPYVGWRAVTKAWFKPKRFQWPTTSELLTPAYLAGLPPPRHPWLAGEDGMLPGQREHVASIARAVGAVGHLNIADSRPTIYPLLSQPLVELCLSIPTWLCCQGGRDRAVARSAFADRLPPSILARRTKGAVDGVIVTTYQRNHRRVREMLLDGGLVRNRILSAAAVERLLKEAAGNGRAAGRLLQCVDIEAWAADWPG